MEIVKFLSQTWQEIPDQDNPAMNYFETKEGLVTDECILMYKGRFQAERGRMGITDEGIVVSLNSNEYGFVQKGVFWTIESAELFASALSDYCDRSIEEAPEIFPGTMEALSKLSIRG